MKKILIMLSLFLIVSCASTEHSKTEPSNPIGNIGKVFEQLTFPKF
jgi:hypothetical protein